MTFPTTNWTVLGEATLSGGDAEREALSKLCESYWKPIATVIRTRGVPVDRVEDMTQDFFLVLMNGGFFRRATPESGKFRSFLLNALRNFLADDARKNRASKRGGELERVELREDSAALEAEVSRFDWTWAEALFDSAVETTGAEMKKKRGEKGWFVLREFLVGSGEVMSYEDLSKALGCSAGGAKTEVSRMRGKFRENLRSEVAKTVSAPHEVDEELIFLRETLMQKSISGDV
ncbi:RNA polymerase sigma factor [Rubritalea sp.]|uniref:RNA polymerase sigma factor n=1 Tax=Rubritalea sp. TaxID=2109375 RepID=UPI003EF547B6